MDNFNVGEIVWAKVRGFPWWPAMITGTEDDNKEKKYVVTFIGDNSHSNVPKKYLAKFEKEYKNYSNTKKKDLLDSIKTAKDMFDNKKGNEEKKPKEIKKTKGEVVSKTVPQVRKDNEDQAQEEQTPIVNNEKQQTVNKTNTANVPLVKEQSHNNNNTLNVKDKENTKTEQVGSNSITTKDPPTFLRKKTKRPDDKEGNDLIHKITSYLIHIAKALDKQKYDVLEDDKECLMKVLEFLKDYKMTEPIEFLKRTNLGKLVKYINNNAPEGEVKDYSITVFQNMEEQVLVQLFRKAK